MKRAVIASVLIAVVIPVLLLGQIPGQNINMVSGTTFPGGDPWLQKQNEPSIAVSTRNPCHLLAGANDYRAVNVQGLPADLEIGDSWVGLYKSINCGQTWFSDLVPGYPQDNSAEGNASPAKGLTTGADPTVRAGTNGTFFYSYIAFNRGSNVGKLVVARYIDNNNLEGFDSIRYLGTTEIAHGSSGQFIDKPIITVTPRSGTCTVNGQTISANTVHIVWTEFIGNSNNVRSKIYYAKSSNCGVSLDGPATKLSEGFPRNQGASIAVSPVDGSIFVTWRQFAAGNDPDGLLFSKSTDGGKKFTKAAFVPIAPLLPFDQPTSAVTFRSNAYSTTAFDHHGRFYLAIASRAFAPNSQARVVVMTTLDGVNWTAPEPVEDLPQTMGHQIMPALTYASDRLQLVWYDFRDTAAAAFGNNPAAHEFFTREIYPLRHTVEVRGAEATVAANGALNWRSYGVLQPADPSATAPRISQYRVGLGQFPPGQQAQGLRLMQYDMPNLRLYAGGTRPFFGDFIDVGGLQYVPRRTANGGQTWSLNAPLPNQPLQLMNFHAVWTDNRDAFVGPDVPGDIQNPTPLTYTAPGLPSCIPGRERARNANIYTSRISSGLSLMAPGNAKPTGTIQRAFAVLVQNTTGQQRRFSLTIQQQPEVTASFTQQGILATVLVDVPAESSASRTVYVTARTIKYPQVLLTALEENPPPGQTPLTATTLLNPDIANPDIANPDIANNELHNPDIANPDIANPDIANPDIANPDIANPDIANPDIANPDIANPDIANPDIANPDIANPDIANPDIANGSITDVTFEVTNDGNTTSGYQVMPQVTGDTSPFTFQLIGRRLYKSPTAIDCRLVEAGVNQIIFDIAEPDILSGVFLDVNNPSPKNATILIDRGETLKVTLRVYDRDLTNGIQPFCPALSEQCDEITHIVDMDIKAQSPNTDGTQTSASSSTLPPELVLAVATETLPPAVFFQPFEGSPTPYPYQQQLLSTGGIGETREWSLACSDDVDCGLPPGIDLSTDGILSGGSTAPGTYNFTVSVTDGVQEAFRDLSILVVAESGLLSFTTQPVDSEPGETFPVAVQVLSEGSVPVEGATVILAILNNTTGALLSPAVPSSTTNASGIASFSISVDRAGSDYSLVAFRGPSSARVSDSFDIHEVFVVTNTNSAGPGSLRQAIEDGNGAAGKPRIRFNVPIVGRPVIMPTLTPLPTLTQPMIIDGTTQPGEFAGPPVVVDGSLLPEPDGPGFPGFEVEGGDTLLKGLEVRNFSGPGVLLAENGSNVIQGMTLTLNETGIHIENVQDNLIGGEFVQAANLIADNTGNGITVTGGDATSNVIRGNVIGAQVDAACEGDGNGANGIQISGSSSNVIGGLITGAQWTNQIACNGSNGILVSSGSFNNLRMNRIDNNVGNGITLGETANGPEDAPDVISALVTAGSTVTVRGTFHGLQASTTYDLDLIVSPGCDGSGFGEGRIWFGSVSMPTNSDGNIDFSGAGFVFPGSPVTIGSGVTMLATSPSGNTSAFSNCVTAADGS